ncbi:hypothetical protein EUTSA_v10023719mg [Eutrema salsugineum]|uniref:Uncharacterized protein n=1 Tax=Eutrema salsugineum TaxID=72664 RepID=V4JVY8_EUTSA|nr:uncharacterized protein LOC18009561 [Eutrema salsugineum]ESQ29580.1 hypothetical protein EUTSA_v10023719mg [Eutrema salsugineum]
MRGQNNNKNRFLRIISMPLKVLVKARDLYMRSITGCAARTHYSSADAVSIPFPRSRSTSSAFSSSASSRRRSSDFTFEDDYSELLRAASVRSLGHKNGIDMFIHQQLQQRKGNHVAVGAVAVAKGGLPKSSSVGMKMAKIDEEDEEEGSVKNLKKGSDFLYPRSRSYAVTIRGSKF